VRDRFDGVQIFVDVVEAGGFAKAADRLSLTRSAVGKAIARLEDRLGVQLFNRTTRALCLTEDGHQYYERCLRAIEELQGGEAMLESGRRDVVGRLRVSLPLLFGRHCVAPILRTFARQHPKLELELSFSDRQVDLVADGFDLAVRNGDLGQGLALRARKLVSQRKVLCASAGYLAARGRPQGLEDLAGHDLLGYWRNGRAMDWRLPDANGVLVDVPVISRLRFDDLEVIVDAVAEGMGLAFVPEWLVAPRIATGDLVEVWPDLPSAIMDCYAVWPATPYMPLRTRLAIDALVAEVPDRLEARRAQGGGVEPILRAG